MTPQQRRELERLYRDQEIAAIQRACAQLNGRPDGPEAEQWTTAYRAVQAYLDEITDYTPAEAVSGS